MMFRLAVRGYYESCVLDNEVPFARSFGWDEKLTTHLHSVKLWASVMTEEILPDRHFFSVDPLPPLFNSIEISVSFNLLDFTLNFAFWCTVHKNEHIHTLTRGYTCACILWKQFNPCNQCFWCPRFWVNVRVWRRCWINRRVLTKV